MNFDKSGRFQWLSLFSYWILLPFLVLKLFHFWLQGTQSIVDSCWIYIVDSCSMYSWCLRLFVIILALLWKFTCALLEKNVPGISYLFTTSNLETFISRSPGSFIWKTQTGHQNWVTVFSYHLVFFWITEKALLDFVVGWKCHPPPKKKVHYQPGASEYDI